MNVFQRLLICCGLAPSSIDIELRELVAQSYKSVRVVGRGTIKIDPEEVRNTPEFLAVMKRAQELVRDSRPAHGGGILSSANLSAEPKTAWLTGTIAPVIRLPSARFRLPWSKQSRAYRMSNNDLKAVLPPDGNLDFELVGHSARAGRMPVHSFIIRTTLESGERVDITEHVAMTLGKKLNKDGALNESGMGYYKPDAIAGSLAEALYDQDRYKHTFRTRTEKEVSEAEKVKHEQIVGLRTAVERSDVDNVNDLLSQGADPNVPDQYGRTALHLVRNNEIANILIEAGADIHAKDGWGETPLQANLYTGPKQVLQSASRREALQQLGSNSREDNDLATPEQAMAARQEKYGRAM